MIDRVRQGHVTDFIYFHFWPAFNIADASIVIGVILLGWSMLRMSNEPSTETAVDTDSSEQRA